MNAFRDKDIKIANVLRDKNTKKLNVFRANTSSL